VDAVHASGSGVTPVLPRHGEWMGLV